MNTQPLDHPAPDENAAETGWRDAVGIWLPIGLVVVLFTAVMLFRPLLPVDETRYMAVAWEMFLRGDWMAALTVNSEPYHHKPPLLFWLINMGWSVFGVSRWAGTLPVLVSSIACLVLTGRLAAALFPGDRRAGQMAPLLLAGSIPFLIYSHMVMFDITLTVFVLLALLALLAYAGTGAFRYLLWMALALGLGVLTKGPVAWLYVIFAILTGPLWMPGAVAPRRWYGQCALALLLSVIPVLFWLIPVLSQSSGDFGIWLVWEQTAGRITGKFSASHVRPFWFYLPLVPALFLPWLVFPAFRKGMKGLTQSYSRQWGLRFLVLSVVPVFIAFSLISGKQPHYLVPLLPAVVVLMAWRMEMSWKAAATTVSVLVAVFVVGQGIASQTIFKRYDLMPIVENLQRDGGRDWVFVPQYHGELNFLARMERPMDAARMEELDQWFATHPDGRAVIRFKDADQVKGYRMLFDMPYRSRRLGIFAGHG